MTLYDSEEPAEAFYGLCKLCGENIFNDNAIDHFNSHRVTIPIDEAMIELVQD